MVASTRLDAQRIGLLADTHDDLVDWPQVCTRISAALDGVEAILHCGDLCTPAALESLRKIAPVLAVRSQADPQAAPPELVDGPRIVEAGGIAIGLINALNGPPIEAELEPELRFPGLSAGRIGGEVFGRPVDVVVFGGSHVPCVASSAGVLFVNPGSPSLAANLTAGRLNVADGVVSARIVPVGDRGVAGGK